MFVLKFLLITLLFVSYPKDKLRQILWKSLSFVFFQVTQSIVLPILFSVPIHFCSFVFHSFIDVIFSHVLIISVQSYLKINYANYFFLTIIILSLHHFTSHYYIFLSPYLSNCYCAILHHITPSLLHIFLHCSQIYLRLIISSLLYLTVPQLFFNILVLSVNLLS